MSRHETNAKPSGARSPALAPTQSDSREDHNATNSDAKHTLCTPTSRSSEPLTGQFSTDNVLDAKTRIGTGWNAFTIV